MLRGTPAGVLRLRAPVSRGSNRVEPQDGVDLPQGGRPQLAIALPSCSGLQDTRPAEARAIAFRKSYAFELLATFDACVRDAGD